MPTAYISHPACLKHEMGAYHPERPERLQAIEDGLVASGLMDLLRYYEAPRATDRQLERVHDPAYIRDLNARAPTEGMVHLDPDTAMNPYSLEAAYRAAGALVLATDLVLSGEVDSAFCAVRPPGHHAERSRAMGFCLFNNIAVGVAHALEAHGLKRVAIVDFDVHHGNGTEKMFAADDRVLLCSSFQHPYYPFADLSHAGPHNIFTPLSAGANGKAFRQAISDQWLPALEAFAPQAIYISAGFDGHILDDLASLALVEEDYGWVTKEVMAMAERHANGRVISTLEGGYALDALARSVQMHIQAMMGMNLQAK